MIVLDGLTKVYGNIVAVDNLSLVIEKGETFGLLGPNGAGKTTTLKMLLTLTKPSSGRAFINGYDVVKNPSEAKKEVGVVPQHINLDNELTAKENLDLHGRLYKMSKKERAISIKKVLSFVKLEERADSLVEEFSGGMKRRLMIARALMHQPSVLFLDEPTVGLDAQTRRKIWDMIRKMKMEGSTILLTTHYIEEADMLCDRVGIIDKGKLIAVDSPRTLKDRVGKVVLEVYSPKETKREFFTDKNEALKYGRKYSNFTIRETNLEDVFIELTGRKME